MQVSEQVSVYLNSTGYFKSHYSQHNVWCQLCQMCDSVLHFSGGPLCVVYIMVGVTNEWDRPEPAEALMGMPKEISLFSPGGRRWLWQYEEGTDCNQIFWGLPSAGVALELRSLVLWGMNIKTRFTGSSGASTTLSVLSSAELCQVRLTGMVDPFEPK